MNTSTAPPPPELLAGGAGAGVVVVVGAGGGVGGGATKRAALDTAAVASIMPAPQVLVVQVESGKGRAVALMMPRTWLGVKSGLTDSISEITPLTCAVETLVP